MDVGEALLVSEGRQEEGKRAVFVDPGLLDVFVRDSRVFVGFECEPYRLFERKGFCKRSTPKKPYRQRGKKADEQTFSNLQEIPYSVIHACLP